jgi:hypothetical protein
MISGFGVRYEDNETLDASDSLTAATDLLDVNIVFFAFFDRFRSKSIGTATTAIASPFITHSIFHLRSSFLPFVRLLREKAAVVTHGRRTFSGQST